MTRPRNPSFKRKKVNSREMRRESQIFIEPLSNGENSEDDIETLKITSPPSTNYIKTDKTVKVNKCNIKELIRSNSLVPEISDFKECEINHRLKSNPQIIDIDLLTGVTIDIDKTRLINQDMEEKDPSEIIGEPNTEEIYSQWPWVVFTILLSAFTFVGLVYWEQIPHGNRGVTFYYMSSLGNEKQEINPSVEGISKVSVPNENEQLYFIIHGYGESTNMNWVTQMSQGLFATDGNSSVILVDYYDLIELDGRRSCDNLLFVASELSSLLDLLVEHKGLRLSRVHLIGYSLGGRVTGMIRHKLNTNQTIGRITALDPSQPWLPPYDETSYLTKEDADLVVTVKSSAISDRSYEGHVHILFNGGYLQPGCDVWWYPTLVQQACSHTRSYRYMVESITKFNNEIISLKSNSSGETIYYYPETNGEKPYLRRPILSYT